ncbi:MAG: Asp-tRNA(Asn)/Glu-tRNA(Gln) amidotransferase subunit GatA [Kiritimatiellae bacterium]|nr:Asp-tRNA(Asn)/Glu-tRNA(Gln) amidotransferase subunit GatA [Kiritimatiellia bacterium]
MDLDISKMTIAAAADGMRAKDFSSVELTQAVLKAIKEKDTEVKAYLTVDEEGALAGAKEADDRRAAGESGDMLGIPVAMKDIFNVKGQPCTCASKILEGYIAPFDATVTRKLREAGAIPAGRVNMDEFAMGSSTEHSAFQITRNPVALDRVPGGSSGGSAAAVAGGTAIASLGTDTGGSIRSPASYCGCVGLKPSYGRVSRYGVTAFASSLDQVGPIVKNVEDAAILLGAIAGADSHDQTVLDREVPDYRAALAGASLKGLRIGVPKEYFIDGCDPEVMASVRKAIDMCANAGAEVREISLPHTEYAIAVYYICATAEASANLARFDGIRYGFRKVGPEATLQSLYDRSRTDGFGKEVKRRIILGTYVLSSGYYDAYYNRALKARTLIRNDFQKAFESCDVIMTPVAPTAAYKLNSTVNDPLKAYLGDIFTVPANLAGICGISVPCGKTSENLPVGLQLLGPAFGEVELLRAAAACEKEFA